MSYVPSALSSLVTSSEQRNRTTRCSALVALVVGISALLAGPVMADGRLQTGTDTSLVGADSLLISQALSSDPDATVFHNALEQAGLDSIIDGLPNVTLFVATDSAMELEGSAFLLQSVLLAPENADRLIDLLSLHIVPAELPGPDSLDSEFETGSLHGACVSVGPYQRNDETGILVGFESRVTHTRRVANGVIYYIDRLLHQSFNDTRVCRATS